MEIKKMSKKNIIESAQSKLSSLLKKASSLNVKAKLAIGLGALALVALALHIASPPNDITASSVMVTNVIGTSGGTGIILESSDTSSLILTNSHVCKILEKGGLVTGRAGKFAVTTYKHSQKYDLCLVTVDGNLHARTKIANRAPVAFYEKALISGHPSLYPNVITSGHFSGRSVISVMEGLIPCTDEQKADPATNTICELIGGLPNIKRFDSTLVTATIMPGSSGSGVYNENNELSGVAFAGSGEGIGYAWVVPYESMRNFLDVESKKLDFVSPD
ncbi:MAG TPA: serine protease, partial [Rhabdochlamydiaceae bacterium]